MGVSFLTRKNRKQTQKMDKALPGLSEAQREIILSEAATKQIVAAAGSGKTRTVTALAGHYLRTGRSRPGRTLLLTFSRKACQEMRERLDADVAAGVQVSTFHGFCFGLLASMHSFTVVGEEEMFRILAPLLRQHKEEIGGIPFSSLLGNPRLFRQEFPELAMKVFRYWIRWKEKHRCLEYDDMIRRSLQWLRSEKGQSRMKAKYDLIIVDEYQDTDRQQLRFLELMQPAHLVTVVSLSESTQSFDFLSSRSEGSP